MGEIFLPNIFTKRLRHLYLPRNYSTQETLQLNGLSELESLFGFRSELFRHTDLSELKNLRCFDAKLGNDDWSQVIDQIDTWEKTEWVKIEIGEESLKQADFGKLLRCRNLTGLHIKGLQIGKLPEYDHQFWPNLVWLWLWDTQIEESIEFLKKLPCLRQLFLQFHAFVGTEINCDSNDFRQVRSLRLHYLPKLEKMSVQEGVMPNLSCLEISKCEKLEIVPEDGLRYFANLKELKIVRMPKAFKDKCEMLSGKKSEDLNEERVEIK